MDDETYVRRRRWSLVAKRSVVEEALKSGNVIGTAKRHGIQAQQIYRWRERLEERQGPATFLALSVASAPVSACPAPVLHCTRTASPTPFAPNQAEVVIRVALAKHEVSGKTKAVAYAPGYGRINMDSHGVFHRLRPVTSVVHRTLDRAAKLHDSVARRDSRQLRIVAGGYKRQGARACSSASSRAMSSKSKSVLMVTSLSNHREPADGRERASARGCR